MASPSSSVPSLAFISAATPNARVVRARLEKRYGAVKAAQADIIVALGGDGLMLQALRETMDRRVPVFGMNCGSVGFLMNPFNEEGLPQRLARAQPAVLHPLRMHAVTASGGTEEALALNKSLATAYYLKEDLRQFWEQPGKTFATLFLDGWLKRAEASGIKRMQQMARTLAAHRSGLLAYYDVMITSGPMEGTNNKTALSGISFIPCFAL